MTWPGLINTDHVTDITLIMLHYLWPKKLIYFILFTLFFCQTFKEKVTNFMMNAFWQTVVYPCVLSWVGPKSFSSYLKKNLFFIILIWHFIIHKYRPFKMNLFYVSSFVLVIGFNPASKIGTSLLYVFFWVNTKTAFSVTIAILEMSA